MTATKLRRLEARKPEEPATVHLKAFVSRAIVKLMDEFSEHVTKEFREFYDEENFFTAYEKARVLLEKAKEEVSDPNWLDFVDDEAKAKILVRMAAHAQQIAEDAAFIRERAEEYERLTGTTVGPEWRQVNR
jgi:hypothetical protein